MNRIYLLVTIDTEEEGLWSGKYPRQTLPVKNIQGIPDFQNICDQYCITPTYLTTYSVSKTRGASDILGPIEASGRCEIGGHLHPWNTPPFEEEHTTRNTLLCHLDPNIIENKLEVMIESHTETFGKRPISFRTGRWGFSEKVARAIEKFGFQIDTSICPFTDFTEEGIPLNPNVLKECYWLNPNDVFSLESRSGAILEVPATVGFNRENFQLAYKIHSYLKKPHIAKFRTIGLLHYLSILKKIALSPEVSSLRDMITLLKTNRRRGISILNLFFHSSSLFPGCSPYVQSKSDLVSFLNKIDSFFSFAKGNFNIEGITLSKLSSSAKKGIL